jgi:hypothetical protein
MPIHDWARVSAGTFHHFHATWIIDLMRALNAGLLPRNYYAMAEQIAGNVGPDVLTLDAPPSVEDLSSAESGGGLAVAPAPPKVRFTEETEEDAYAHKRRRLVIRHSSDDRVVALLEILSPGNKASRDAIRSFVEKAAGALRQGIHLLVIDLHPRTPRDPDGDMLPDMPLYLTPELYVNVPLEATYRTAYDAVPRRWRDVLEGRPTEAG